MYSLHPSQRLRKLFSDKPYQGASPEKAKYLFVGLDANYAPEIEHDPIFEQVLDYHADGVAFWQRHGVHHPFMLPQYSGDGRFYHKSFARTGFAENHAGEVSFVELLDVPTTGRNQLKASDLDADHLKWISRCILQGDAKHIFISSTVLRLMLATGIFFWLPSKPRGERFGLRKLFEKEQKTVYLHLHFSNYGKFEAEKQREAESIQSILDYEAGQ